MQQEYSQPPILPSPHFWWVVKGVKGGLFISSTSTGLGQGFRDLDNRQIISGPEQLVYETVSEARDYRRGVRFVVGVGARA